MSAEACAQLKRELRSQRVRQKDLADALGLTQKHVSQILTGKVRVTGAFLDAAAAELGCTWRIQLIEDLGEDYRSIRTVHLPEEDQK